MTTSQKLSEILKDSTLEAFFAETLKKVKATPNDLAQREKLFKLYCLQSQWEKALIQLETWALIDGHDDDKQLEVYKNLIFSEILREQVLLGKREPMTMDQTLPDWMNKMQLANKLLAEGKEEESQAARLDAFEQAPAAAGNGTVTGAFDWIADNDSRLGPVCEFIIAGGYRWVPYADIETINISKPRDLLDLIWIHAQVKVKDGIFYGYIPARYPLTEADDDAIKLGNETKWTQVSEDFLTGKGRKMIITDQGDYSLPELDKISISKVNEEE